MTTDARASGEAPVISPATEEISPFSLHVPQADLDDLRQRLAGVRWSTPETVNDWSQGVPLATAQELISYWQHSYDWRRPEQRLNGYPQFRTSIDGLGIHFIHVQSRHADALPIVLTHGWPGSVIEFLETPVDGQTQMIAENDVVTPGIPQEITATLDPCLHQGFRGRLRGRQGRRRSDGHHDGEVSPSRQLLDVVVLRAIAARDAE